MSDETLNDIPSELRKEFVKVDFATKVKPGMKIAITAGSRGINNYPLILKTIVELLRELGTEPFIVPTMGSHGGATAEGQVEVLNGLGITPDTLGAPIQATMDVVELGQTDKESRFILMHMPLKPMG